MLIAARESFAAARWKNPYITDGLVAMWDGEWNVGGGRHSASTTTWKDLCGGANQDFALTEHGTWGANCLQTDGLGAAALCGKLFDYSQILTVESVGQIDVAAAARSLFNLATWYRNGGTNYTTRMFMYSTNASGNGYTFSGFASSRKCYVSSAVGVRLGVSARYDAQTCNALTVNGAEQTATSLTHGAGASSSQTHATIGAGNETTTGALAQGKLYTLRLYSRVITAAEIAANYAIDKARFNLP